MTSRCHWKSALVLGLLAMTTGCQQAKVRVGSKLFPESRTLAEMARSLALNEGVTASHRQIGASKHVWQALVRGDINIYPDYTGTLRFETLRGVDDLDAYLANRGLKLSKSLGFENNYAFGMRRDVAKEKGITKISQLRAHPEIRYGFSREFIDRNDGWNRLRERYSLSKENVTSFEHLLAYEALKSGQIDVMEVYTTDGKINLYDVVLLEDDLEFFPVYQAVWVYRPADIPKKALDAILRLEGEITEEEMRKLNGAVVQNEMSSNQAAVSFLNEKFDLDLEPTEESIWNDMLRWTGQHLLLVSLSLSMAIVVAIPVGVLAYRVPAIEQVVLGVVGLMQTIPSLAMLSFLLPLFGVGSAPAIVALFLYSLLPIVRNTHTGLKDIPNSLRESAMALGMPSLARLWYVELPLASRSILAGIKTSAVINVGFATLGAFIGAGGYGEPILTGMSLNNMPMVLQGAAAAAVMALLVQGLFELTERYLAPRGLRVQSEAE